MSNKIQSRWTCELCFEKIEAPQEQLPRLMAEHRREAHGLKTGDSQRGLGGRRGTIPKGMFKPLKG